MLEQKLNELKLTIVLFMQKRKKNCSKGSVKYRRVDRTVWNHNPMALPVTLDPLECKILIIKHLNGTNNKTLEKLLYNKTFTLLDHCFRGRLEQKQTLFTVHQINKMYTGTSPFWLPIKIEFMILQKTLITTVLINVNLKSTSLVGA